MPATCGTLAVFATTSAPIVSCASTRACWSYVAVKMPSSTPKARSRPTTIRPRLIARPLGPALARRKHGPVRARIDHGGKPGARGQPVHEPGDDEREHVEIEALPERRLLAARAPTTFTDARPEHHETRGNTRACSADDCEHHADTECRECPPHSDAASRSGEMNGEERQRGSDRPRNDAEQHAFRTCKHEERSPARTARAQQRKLASVAFDGSERREIGKPERDERAGQREHDVERLRVEGVTRRARKA